MHTIEIHTSRSKDETYRELLPQVKALLEGEPDTIANQANFCAALKQAFNWWWVGFYFVKGDELVLGPFQGPVACTRITRGKGVCGTAWLNQEIIIVPDVNQFPGHIACSALSKSEIVIPLFDSTGAVVGVLDIDSEFEACFDETDARYLKELLTYLM